MRRTWRLLGFVVAAGCAATKPRAVEIDPVDRAMAAEEKKLQAPRVAPPDELPPAPFPLHVVARARNTPLTLRRASDGSVGVRAGAVTAVARPREADLVLAPLAPDEALAPPSPRPEYCWTHVAAVPTGEVFAAGTRCKGRAASAERWARGEARGIVDMLPGVDWEAQAGVLVGPMHARAADDVMIAVTYTSRSGAARPYLAHFDGTEWKAPPVPLRKPFVTSLATTADGEVFLTQSLGREMPEASARGSELWRRDAARTWRRIALPPPTGLSVRPAYAFRAVTGAYEEVARGAPPAYEPVEVYAAAKDDVWVVASWGEGDDEHWVVLRSRVPARTLALGDRPSRVTPPPLATCNKTYFVPLGPVPPSGPDGFDFLSVRAAFVGERALDGALLLETVAGGTDVYGVFLRDAHAAARAAARIATWTRAKTPPLAVCAAPQATRIARFDVATGDLVE